MKKQTFALLLAACLTGTGGFVATSRATTYAGNGNSGFVGAVGQGSLSVTNNAAGAYIFTFTLGNQQTGFSGNDLVLYIDNNKGGGITTSTANLTDTNDGGRSAVSEYSINSSTGASQRSILAFNGLFAPQYALDLSFNNGNAFGLVNNGMFSFLGGQTIGGTSQNGITYTTGTNAGNTFFTATVPATIFGLTANTVNTLKLVAIEVSETGYSSNEATVALTGNQGFGNTQTLSAINSYTSAVPEPSTWALIIAGGAGLIFMGRRRAVVG